MARIKWARLPSTYEGYRATLLRQERYARYSRLANVSLVAGFLIFNVGIALGFLGLIGIAQFSLSFCCLITIIVIIQRNQLYIQQLEDREITKGYLYAIVYLTCAMSILLWG